MRRGRERKIKNNILIIGLKETERGNIKKVEDWIKKMEMRVKINDVWTTGKAKKIIVTKCESGEEKERITKNKSKIGEEKVYIDNDLTWNERRIREKVIKLKRKIKK